MNTYGQVFMFMGFVIFGAKKWLGHMDGVC